jgi:hypothetical protein
MTAIADRHFSCSGQDKLCRMRGAVSGIDHDVSRSARAGRPPRWTGSHVSHGVKDVFSCDRTRLWHCLPPRKTIDTGKTHSRSAGLEASGLGIEASDPHDQCIVRIARPYDPGSRLHVLSCQYDNAHTAVATIDRPLEVRYPLHAYLLGLASQRRSKSRLIRHAFILANNLVLPHRHNDCSSVIADRGSTKVPARASCTEMLERSRECPICFHCRCYANDVSTPEDSVADSATPVLEARKFFHLSAETAALSRKTAFWPPNPLPPALYLACNF